MKNVYYILILISALHLTSCDKVQEGYLETVNVAYNPDSIVIKAVLDPVEDEHQIKFGIPWISTAIEGLDGTRPFTFKIKNVHTDNGLQNAEKQISVNAAGAFEIPYNHNLTQGSYTINLIISNIHETVEKDSIFRIIVK